MILDSFSLWAQAQSQGEVSGDEPKCQILGFSKTVSLAAVPLPNCQSRTNCIIKF
jgi:hypothetical protein